MRGNILDGRVHPRPNICMLRPIRRPNVKGFAAQQQVEGQAHLLAQLGSENRIRIGADPPAVGKAAAGVLIRPARGLDDPIQGDMFMHDDFSHAGDPFVRAAGNARSRPAAAKRGSSRASLDDYSRSNIPYLRVGIKERAPAGGRGWPPCCRGPAAPHCCSPTPRPRQTDPMQAGGLLHRRWQPYP